MILRPNNSNLDDIKLPLNQEIETKLRGFIYFNIHQQLNNNQTLQYPYFLLLNSDGKFCFYEFIDIRENNERFLKSPIVCSDDGLSSLDDKENEKTQDININKPNVPHEKITTNNVNLDFFARSEGSKSNNFGPSLQNNNISLFDQKSLINYDKNKQNITDTFGKIMTRSRAANANSQGENEKEEIKHSNSPEKNRNYPNFHSQKVGSSLIRQPQYPTFESSNIINRTISQQQNNENQFQRSNQPFENAYQSNNLNPNTDENKKNFQITPFNQKEISYNLNNTCINQNTLNKNIVNNNLVNNKMMVNNNMVNNSMTNNNNNMIVNNNMINTNMINTNLMNNNSMNNIYNLHLYKPENYTNQTINNNSYSSSLPISNPNPTPNLMNPYNNYYNYSNCSLPIQNKTPNISNLENFSSLFERQNNSLERGASLNSSESFEIMKAKYISIDFTKCKSIIENTFERSRENIKDCVKGIKESYLEFKSEFSELG